MYAHLLQKYKYFFILIFIATIISNIPNTVFAQENAQYATCANSVFNCSNKQNFPYPFWGPGRPRYCGHPAFELNCSGDAPEITINSTAYRMLDFDTSKYILSVARADYWHTNCPRTRRNSTSDPSPFFSYAADTQNLTLFYNCSVSSTAVLPPTRFTCTEDVGVTNFFGTDDVIKGSAAGMSAILSSQIQSCTETVIVRISNSEATALTSSITSNPTQLVNLTAVLDSGFEINWSANDSRCEDCQKSGGLCGSTNSTTSVEFSCYCKEGSFSLLCGLNSNPSPGSGSGTFLKRDENIASFSTIEVDKGPFWVSEQNDSNISAANGNLELSSNLDATDIGIVAALLAPAVFAIVIILCWYKRELGKLKRETRNDFDVEAFIKNYDSFAPKRYTYANLKKMTNSFAEKIGGGGYGAVYKGQLPEGVLVAVKMLNESKGNGEEFVNEVASIGRTSHVNIVTLLGFCYEGKKRALVYEYMPNGSLDRFVFNQGPSNASCRLEWKTLYEIAVGIARGLDYLHQGCNTRILHFDIKPHNILLDKKFRPKISDFGLSKLCQTEESVVSMKAARGTAGYIAPEVLCRNIGGVSYKSDVYSYGMMVLEMVGGRRNIEPEVSRTSEIYFPNWLQKHIEDQNFKLSETMTTEEAEIARKMIVVSLWCTQTMPSDRPSMSKVVEMLDGSMQSLEIPQKSLLPSTGLPTQA